jgi:hypothetical protein
MKTTITKKAERLLVREFAWGAGWKRGARASAIHTCSGTRPLWGQLVRAGLVKPTFSLLLGHPFAYAITDAGEYFIWLRSLEPLNRD